ncbi:MAG: RNA polymerase sigma factor [Ardenticatenaceae bacterium]|nr:RNA polymerase sigma factor [Anaerolineales bacterium]MCB8976195.1 RNA polymerase sigma factor [Ardenticatenaceae bacterium]
MSDDHTLEQLLTRCQQGDLEAFAALFRHFRQYVYDLACVILRDTTAAQDAVQDTFLRVMEKIDTFAGEAAFETWLTAVTVNTCRTHLRRQKVRRFLSLDRMPPGQLLHGGASGPNVAHQVEERLHRQSLWEMVNSLPDRLRLPLILRYRYGLSCNEISAALSVRLGTVYQQLNEGRRQLEQMATQKELEAALTLASGESG